MTQLEKYQISLDKIDSRPLYLQLANSFKYKILNGEIPTGVKLPTSKELANYFNVSIKTSENALLHLEKESLIYRRTSNGSIVRKSSIKLKKDNLSKVVNLGLLVQDIISIAFPIHAHLLSSLEKTNDLYKNNYNFITYPFKNREIFNNTQNEFIAKAIYDKHIQGLLICTPIHRKDIVQLNKLNIPFISLLTETYKNLEYMQIAIDSHAAGFIFTEYLAKLGHKKIVVLGSGEFKEQMKEIMDCKNMFFEGYRDAIKKYELTSHPMVKIRLGDISKKNIEQVVKKLLKSSIQPTAIITFDDNVALRTIEAINKEGLKVPEDISVIGGTNSVDSDFLSTADYPFDELSKKVFGTFKMLFNCDEIETKQIIIKPKLLIKKSCI